MKTDAFTVHRWYYAVDQLIDIPIQFDCYKPNVHKKSLWHHRLRARLKIANTYLKVSNDASRPPLTAHGQNTYVKVLRFTT